MSCDTILLRGTLTVRPYIKGIWLDPVTYEQTITTAGKNWVVDNLQNLLASTENLKWHKTGTGTAAFSTATTTFSSSTLPARTAGTLTEGASANIFRSVATVNYTGTKTITRWAIFTTSSGGTLFSGKNHTSQAVNNGDGIQYTWDLTVS